MGLTQRALHHPAVPFVAAILLILTLSGVPVFAQTTTLGYGGDGVYPRHCSANSQRWFRVQTDIGADTTVLTQVSLSGPSGGPFNPSLQVWPKPRTDYLDGVIQYYPGPPHITVHTVGPFTGVDPFNPSPHSNWCMGTFYTGDAVQFIFTAVYWPKDAKQPTVHTPSNVYWSTYDDRDTLEWYQSPAAGVDPLAVTPGQLDPDTDNGAGDSTYTFRVQYANGRNNSNYNLPPRMGANEGIPGPYGSWVNFDLLPEAAPTTGDAGSIRLMGDYLNWVDPYPWTIAESNDPWLDRTGDYVAIPNKAGAVVDGNFRQYEMSTSRQVILVLDGNINAPHFMIRENPNDNQFGDGVIYHYVIQPTHYLHLLDNLFQFRYDPPGDDTQDTITCGIHGTPVDNGYAALSAGVHQYEFLASDDFQPPRGVAYCQVGRPGFQTAAEYLHPRPHLPEFTSPVYYVREPVEVRATRPFGYPYDSRTHPYVNPVLSAFPYFPEGNVAEGCVAPYSNAGGDPRRVPVLSYELFNGSTYPLFPVISPFEAAGLGPEGGPQGTIVGGSGRPFEPTHYTNNDTIRPSYANIWDANPADPTAVPLQGGKWTQSTKYTFLINYWGNPSLPPQYIRVMVRRNDHGQSPTGAFTGFTMQQLDPSATDFTKGVVYRYQISAAQLPGGGGPGEYNYFFTASDGQHTTNFPRRPPRYTDTETNFQIPDFNPLFPTTNPQTSIGVPQDPQGGNGYYAFRVNHPPVLSGNDVEPPSGRVGSDFNFSVTYQDVDGEMLNAGATGDEPFRAQIGVDLFGDPNGQNGVVGVTTGKLTYVTHPNPADWTQVGANYPTGSLVSATRPYYLRVEEAANPAAVGLTYKITANDATSITATPVAPALGLGTDPITAANSSYRGDRFIIVQWFTGTMTKVDPTNHNAKAGIKYQFNTANLITLGPGTHRYYFQFTDDWGDWIYPNDANVSVEGETVRNPTTGEYEGPVILQNHAPWLSNYRYTPKAAGSGQDGTTATPFTFSVTYTDQDNDPPGLIRLKVDGTSADDGTGQVYDLTRDPNSKTPFSNGVTYVSPAVRLSAGNHIFRAQATDGELRYPPTATPSDPLLFKGPWSGTAPPSLTDTLPDSAAGPKVAQNTPPQLIFPTDDQPNPTTNRSPGLKPDSGTGTDTFTFTIIYKDTDVYAGVQGNPPLYVRVYLDGSSMDMTAVNPSDADFTDGNTYTATVTGLAAGVHAYYFLTSDGRDLARQPLLTDTNYPSKQYDGPTIKNPPGEPKALTVQDVPNDQGGAVQGTFNPSADDGGGTDNVVEYRLYRSTSATMSPRTLAKVVAATKAGAYAFIDDTAPKNTNLWYVARAWNGDPSPSGAPPLPAATKGGFESIDSNIAGPAQGLDNIAPKAPTNLSATNPGLGKEIDLSWTKSADDGAGASDVTEYHIYRTTTSGSYTTQLGTAAAGATTYKDTTTSDGVNYFYIVRAFDGINESLNSNEAGPIQSTDTKPPVFSDLKPLPNAHDVPADTTIAFTVTDTGAGVDVNSLTLTVTVAGTAVPGSLGQTPVTNGFRFTFTPDKSFNQLDVVQVHIEVSDLAVPTPNHATQDYRFTVNPPPTFAIKGTIIYDDGHGNQSPLPNVVVSAGALSAKTDVNGVYSILGLINGTYVVKPVLRGYAFTPTSKSVTVKSADVTGIDFAAVAGYDTSGRVIILQGGKNVGLPNVKVSNGIADVLTDANGQYQIKDSPAGNYTVRPTLAGYVFDPEKQTVVLPNPNTGGGTGGVNFQAAVETFTVSGVVSTSDGGRLQGADVTASLGGKVSASDTTDTNGAYQLKGLPAGTYDVAVTRAHYTFEPAKLKVTVGPDSANNDFVAFELFTHTYPTGLAFLAIPVLPKDTSIIDALGISPELIARWDPTRTGDNKYVYANVEPTAAILQLGPGRGYFADFRPGKTIQVPGTLLRTTDTFTFELQAGYNMAGNPYPAALPWSDLAIAADGPVANFGFILRPGTRIYDLVSTVPELHGQKSIPTGAGFWIHSDGATTLLSNAPNTTAAVPTPAADKADANNWVIPITAKAGDAADLTGRCGILEAAQTRPANFRVPKPPTIPGTVNVYFIDNTLGHLACDIRPTPDTENVWQFGVATDMKNTPVTLSLPDLSAVPNNLRVTLVDVAANKRLYARTLRNYTYNSRQGGERLFRLEIEQDQGGELVIGTASAQPSRAGVVVSYSISQRAAVSVEIRNIAGRRIASVLHDKELAAGRNETIWNLLADSGTKVPAGQYLVVLEAVSADGQRARAMQPITVER